MIVLGPKDTLANVHGKRKKKKKNKERRWPSFGLNGLGSGDLRLRGAHVGQLPFEVFLKVLQALKGDFELVGRVERCRVVYDLDVE